MGPVTANADVTAAPRRAALAVNPWILAVAAINLGLALAFGSLIAPIVWSVDGDRNLGAAQALAAGTFGVDRGYLYSPLAAALTLPAAMLIPHVLAVAGWLIGRLGVLGAGIARETRGRSMPDRVLVAIAAIAFVPSLHDLLLGNVSILITAAVAIVAWAPDRYASGLPLGVVLATVPKPALIPILVWMVVFRRRALLSAVGSAAILSGLGLVVLGASAYAGWFQVLLHPYYLATNQTGNLALGAMLPGFLAWPLMALTVIATVVALRRGETPGFLACLCAGLLIAPYTMAYGAVILLLGVRPLARVAPMRTFLLAASGSLGVILFLPLWVGAILATTLSIPRNAWNELSQGVTS
jgi:hypothetical protein